MARLRKIERSARRIEAGDMIHTDHNTRTIADSDAAKVYDYSHVWHFTDDSTKFTGKAKIIKSVCGVFYKTDSRHINWPFCRKCIDETADKWEKIKNATGRVELPKRIVEKVYKPALGLLE